MLRSAETQEGGTGTQLPCWNCIGLHAPRRRLVRARGYTAPTRVPISCHSCHGHYLHIVIAGSVKDYYYYYYYYYYYDYDNTITNTYYKLLHLYPNNVFTIRSQAAYMCQMSPDKCHYQYMTDILEPGQFTILCEIKVMKKRTAMTNRQTMPLCSKFTKHFH
jgi:hypothetical protein